MTRYYGSIFLKTIETLYNITSVIVYYTGLHFLISRLLSKRALILSYHSISSTENERVYPDNIVSPENFERQLNYLNKIKRIVPLSTVIGYIHRGEEFPQNLACITFNDGYLDYMENAYPLLKEQNNPSTIFPITQHLESGRAKWDDHMTAMIYASPREKLVIDMANGTRSFHLLSKADRRKCILELNEYLAGVDPSTRRSTISTVQRICGDPGSDDIMMSWGEIEELSGDALISIGCHTHTHQNLGKLIPEESAYEIVHAKEILKEGLKRECLHFCYPYGGVGSYNEEVKRLLHKEGFQTGLTTRRGLVKSDSDPYELRRIVARNDSSHRFKCSLIGLTLQR